MNGKDKAANAGSMSNALDPSALRQSGEEHEHAPRTPFRVPTSAFPVRPNTRPWRYALAAALAWSGLIVSMVAWHMFED